VPDATKLLWTYQLPVEEMPTAPITVGGLTFVADRAGVVRALDGEGKLRWSVRTGGPVYFPPTVAGGRAFVGSADGRVYALEAATGRFLWSYRVAPEARWIPVYGKLISTWPVAGGVAVEDGVVYAAAGIAHYDGTYVVALDAVSGKPLWQNSSSGKLAEDVNCGISLQGELQIRGNELQFLGGGAYLYARYDRKTGECLNQPRSQVTSQFQTAFYPYFPTYGKYSSLNHTFPDGRTLAYYSSYDGSRPTRLGVLAPAPTGKKAQSAPPKKRRSTAPGNRPQRKPVWQTNQPELFTAFVVTPQTLIAGGPAKDDQRLGRLSAINMENGKTQWVKELPSVPVKAGIAMDHQHRIVVSLEDGQILCYGSAE
jgi:outer membrane protein assembly factor BamB